MQEVKYVSKVTTNGRISLGAKVMEALHIKEGDFVQLVVNPKGPEVKVQKVSAYEI